MTVHEILEQAKALSPQDQRDLTKHLIALLNIENPIEWLIEQHQQQPEQVVVDDMGYPEGYFDETYGMFADDPIERNQPSDFEQRDSLE